VERAFRAVAADLERVADRARAQGRRTVGDIVAVGALIATDVALIGSARQAVTSADPLQGIREAVERYAAILDALPDETLRERAADVRQVGRRVVERLVGRGVGTATRRQFVVVAEELGPADLLEHLGQGLVAAVAVRGGANSHAAIIARSMGLPLVVGVDLGVLALPDDTTLLVDGDAGLVVAQPSEAEVTRTDATSARQAKRREVLASERGLPHVTADGQPFMLLCNVASDIEVRAGRDSGATGVGLLRTELPFLDHRDWPGEADHRRALRPILAEAVGWPVTVRLLDFANDKIPPFLHGQPAGLTALFAQPGALDAQLRAVLDPGHGGATQVRIMVPMVTGADDVRTVRDAVATVAGQLGVGSVPVGAMIETLAAVESIDELCRVADFLSIGTNDLTSQVLDVDRTDPRARPELSAHPLVLELVGRVVAGAARAGRPVTVCGDAGSHPVTVPLLVGAGVRSLSVAAARTDETRYLMRRLDTTRCAEVFTEALRQRDADQTAALVHARLPVAVP
jgi:phosphoenolpyruvate-protein kinase (PTS system EI component)